MGHTTTVHDTAHKLFLFPHDCLPSLLPLTIFSLPDESNVLDEEKILQPVKETWWAIGLFASWKCQTPTWWVKSNLWPTAVKTFWGSCLHQFKQNQTTRMSAVITTWARAVITFWWRLSPSSWMAMTSYHYDPLTSSAPYGECR
jgi:hypothetical protein